jgi:hypothetical protein
VHLFKRNQAGQWQPHVEVEPPNPWLTSDFGRSVAVSSGTLAVGDPYASVVNYEEAGKAYLYQLEVEFRRGDCNGDGGYNVADVVFTLGALFAGGPQGTCIDAGDANDDGAMNVADAVFTLGALFSGGPPLPDPGPVNCGPDPTSTTSIVFPTTASDPSTGSAPFRSTEPPGAMRRGVLSFWFTWRPNSTEIRPNCLN